MSRVEEVDVLSALREAGHTKPLLTEREASDILATYGFHRNVTRSRKVVPLTDVAADLARRLNEKGNT